MFAVTEKCRQRVMMSAYGGLPAVTKESVTRLHDMA